MLRQLTNDMTPKEIVNYLNKHIVGQIDAKRAIAIAMRNRWRRMQLESPLKDEVMPKNILMIGPTGVGKVSSLSPPPSPHNSSTPSKDQAKLSLCMQFTKNRAI